MIVSAITVREAVKDTLQTWLPWTLGQVCLAHGLDVDHVDPPAADAYHELHDMAQLEWTDPRKVTLAVVVADEAYTRSDTLDAQFPITINVIGRGASHGDTVDRIDLYRTAIRQVLHQHQGLGIHPRCPEGTAPLSRSTRVTGSSYRPIANSSRLILSGVVTATAYVDDIADRWAAVDTPPEEPWDEAEFPVATDVTTTVQPEEDE